jgi:hypothetical protein
VITYFDAGPDHAAVRTAVRAWNASGVRIRFRAVSRRRAAVQVERQGGRCAGTAQLGYVRGARARVRIARCPDALSAAGVATHELGHVLGLVHEDRICATMNAVLWQGCRQAPSYFGRCRLLERDDVAGAVRRYGGRVRPVRAHPFCPLFAAPAPATDLRASVEQDSPGAITLRFGSKAPRRLERSFYGPPYLRARIYRSRGTCRPGRPAGKPIQEVTANAGRTTRAWVGTRLELAPGPWCFAVWIVDATGRPARAAATTTVQVVHQAPVAAIDGPESASAGEPVDLGDVSSPGEAQEITRRRDFGDGTAQVDAPRGYVEHTYEQPGTYVVALTVTDEAGQSSTATHPIRIVPPPEPEP